MKMTKYLTKGTNTYYKCISPENTINIAITTVAPVDILWGDIITFKNNNNIHII